MNKEDNQLKVWQTPEIIDLDVDKTEGKSFSTSEWVSVGAS